MIPCVSSSSVDPARLQLLNNRPHRQQALYVLLWVQQDVRASCNHALEFAIEEANKLGLPVLACYGLYERFPNATERAFSFLLEGLRDAREAFASRGVRLVCKRAPPPDVVVGFAEQHAACVIVDRSYAKICRGWRRRLVERLPHMRIVQVETNVVVPVGLASSCREPAAATLRPKIKRLLPRFFAPCPEVALQHPAPEMELPAELEAGVFDIRDPSAALAELDVDRTVPPVSCFRGGGIAASARLDSFLPKLKVYGNGKSNDPSRQDNSFLSPYLHFGHISPLDVCLHVRAHATRDDKGVDPCPGFTSGGASGADAFIEELIVRRELARNFCSYCDDYSSFECVPDWAQRSLLEHASDPRTHTYTLAQLERGETDDPCWNAAQWEMVATGHMHNYMRMYWCKQLLTWTNDPRQAFEWAVHLNDRYSLDGRDENGYMGIAWCFGQHDRPFPERPVFGLVRPMTRGGLESKYDMGKYRSLVNRKCRDAAVAEPRYRSILPSAAFGGGGALLRFVARPATSVPATASAPSTGGQGAASHDLALPNANAEQASTVSESPVVSKTDSSNVDTKASAGDINVESMAAVSPANANSTNVELQLNDTSCNKTKRNVVPASTPTGKRHKTSASVTPKEKTGGLHRFFVSSSVGKTVVSAVPSVARAQMPTTKTEVGSPDADKGGFVDLIGM